jgi:hypothetical protein
MDLDQSPPETTVRRLLGRFARHRRPARPPITVPHATHNNPNREFARKDGTAVWFFVFLPIFLLLYTIVEKMHVR